MSFCLFLPHLCLLFLRGKVGPTPPRKPETGSCDHLPQGALHLPFTFSWFFLKVFLFGFKYLETKTIQVKRKEGNKQLLADDSLALHSIVTATPHPLSCTATYSYTCSLAFLVCVQSSNFCDSANVLFWLHPAALGLLNSRDAFGLPGSASSPKHCWRLFLHVCGHRLCQSFSTLLIEKGSLT